MTDPPEAADEVIDPVYLPFTPQELDPHFVKTPNDHLAYYLKSVGHHHESEDPTSLLALQIEKDERFWVITALKRLFDQGPSGALFAHLLKGQFPDPPVGYDSWSEALRGELRLYFEVSLPAPKKYLAMMRQPGELMKRNPSIPHLHQAKSGIRYEGASRIDALLLSPAQQMTTS